MSDLVITPWFDPDVLPVRPGIYMVEYAEHYIGPEYQYFDGHWWFYGCSNVEDTYNLYLTHATVRDHVMSPHRWAGVLK